MLEVERRKLPGPIKHMVDFKYIQGIKYMCISKGSEKEKKWSSKEDNTWFHLIRKNARISLPSLFDNF